MVAIILSPVLFCVQI